MNEPDELGLTFALRLVPGHDSIGVPVFSESGRNALYVPETDGDLRISKFLEFYNDEGYPLDGFLPKSVAGRVYRLGDPSPMPFWIDGVCQIINGDAERSDIERSYGPKAKTNDVIRDVGQLLADARNGVFNAMLESWVARDIAVGFGDVFYEPPIHSRYWISRFAQAKDYARKLTKSPHPIDDEIRRVANAWLRRFATKTDYPRLLSLMGNLQDGLFDEARARSVLLAYFTSKIRSGNFAEVQKHVQDPVLERLFPEGLHTEFWTKGWPNVPFKYARPHDLLDPLKGLLKQSRNTGNYLPAARMTYLFFRRGKIPNDLDNLARPLLYDEIQRFERKFDEWIDFLNDESVREDWRPMADDLVHRWERVMDLDGIVSGDARLLRVPRTMYNVSRYQLMDIYEKAGRGTEMFRDSASDDV